MRSEPGLLSAASKQFAAVQDDPLVFLGWWMAWKNQPGIDPGDLTDLIKQAGLTLPSAADLSQP